MEIERKFLVTNYGYRSGTSLQYNQGYLCVEPERTVRVRVAGTKAFLTVKGETIGISREEFEYEIPTYDAVQMLKMCTHKIEKVRYTSCFEGKKWEVDEFQADNFGLVVAEIELATQDEEFVKPPWLGKEVSDDPRYYNAALAVAPFTSWQAI